MWLRTPDSDLQNSVLTVERILSHSISDSERKEIEQPDIYSLGVKLEQMVEQILKTRGFSTERRLKLKGESGATHE